MKEMNLIKIAPYIPYFFSLSWLLSGYIVGRAVKKNSLFYGMITPLLVQSSTIIAWFIVPVLTGLPISDVISNTHIFAFIYPYIVNIILGALGGYIGGKRMASTRKRKA